MSRSHMMLMRPHKTTCAYLTRSKMADFPRLLASTNRAVPVAPVDAPTGDDAVRTLRNGRTLLGGGHRVSLTNAEGGVVRVDAPRQA